MCQYRFINPSKCTILLVDFDNGRGNACAEVGHIWEICIFCSIFLCTYNFCKNSFKKFWQLLSMINIYFLSCVCYIFLITDILLYFLSHFPFIIMSDLSIYYFLTCYTRSLSSYFIILLMKCISVVYILCWYVTNFYI